MTEEKLKQLIVRLPESMHTWLKENVTGQSINDFMVELLKARIQNTEVATQPDKAQAQVKTEEPLTDEIRELLYVRKIILETGYLDDGVGYKRDYFADLEKEWLRDLKPANPSMMVEYVGTFGEYVAGDYFENMLKLSDHDKRLMYAEIKKLTCEGDPGEVVYKDVTRESIFDLFDRRNEYRITDIAGKLGLSYQETYNKVVPWMVANKFKVK